jgi:transposase
MTALGAAMAKAKAWEVTDEFWKRVEPLIPVRQRPADQNYTRSAGGGRKPKDPRLVFEGIVYVLRTGCQWKALPAERYGSASAIHARFLEWEKAGVFEALWKLGLAEYDEFEGIAWRWQSIDGAMMKAPLAQQSVGPNPTDRGKKREQAPSAGGRSWRPVVARRDRSASA